MNSNAYILKKVFVFISFLVILEPMYLSNIARIDVIYNALKIIVALIVLCLYLGKGQISFVSLTILFYHLYLILRTVQNNGDIKSSLVQSATFIAFCLLLEMVIKENTVWIFNILLPILEVYVYINFLTIIIFPDGLYSTYLFENNYFLGYDNQNINFILPAMALSLLNYYRCRGHWFRTLCLLTTSVLTVIVTWSGASLIIVSGFVAFTVFRRMLSTKHFNLRTYLIINVVCFWLLVIVRLQNYFSYFIEDVLEKSLTLTGRTLLWDITLAYIKRNPVLGYGIETTVVRGLKNGKGANHPFSLHAHDRILEILYRGGIILLIIQIIILILACRKAMKHKESVEVQILSFSLFLYLTGMLTEYYDYSPFFWGFMVMCSYSNHLIKNRGPGG